MFSSRWSENAPVKSPTTPGWANYGEEKSNVFNRHLVQKIVIRAVYVLVHPERCWEFLRIWQRANGIWGLFIGAYDRASFQKYVKNVKDFRCYVNATSATAVSAQSEHPVATATRIGHLSIYLSFSAMETDDLTFTSRHGINNKHLHKLTFLINCPIFPKTSTKPPRTEVYNQFGYLQLPLKLTSLLISHIKKNVPFFW